MAFIHKLTIPEEDNRKSMSDLNSELVECPTCSKEISDNATHCPNCGEIFDDEFNDRIKRIERNVGCLTGISLFFFGLFCLSIAMTFLGIPFLFFLGGSN